MKTLFKNRRQAEQEQVLMDVNMTPLIDVMLVLIIMLIISIPIQQHAINMLNPASNAQQQQHPPTPVSIDILQHGQLRWNGQPLPTTLLESRFKELAAQQAAYEVRIRPAPASDYKDMTLVLATAQRQGITSIGLYE